MGEAVVNRRGLFGLALITAFIVSVLAGLGLWQLRRGAEKDQLMAALNEQLKHPAAPLPLPSQWSGLTRPRDEFRRVTFDAVFDSKPDAIVYSVGSAIRADISGPGIWVFLPARLAGGETIVVNLGFVPTTLVTRAPQGAPQAGQDNAAGIARGERVSLTGYLRFPDAAGRITPQAEPARRLWFTRDHIAMARELGWGARAGEVAPFYIDLESPAPASGPKPGPLRLQVRGNHLQYAITWFGLAAVVLIVFLALWRAQIRIKRAADDQGERTKSA